MKKFTILLLGAVFMFAAGSASATALNPINNRPVTVNPAAAGENSLQDELDALFGIGVVDDLDQLGVGMFRVSTPGSTLVSPQFRFEWTANATSQGVGMFGWNGTNTVNVAIFNGANAAGDYANVKWLNATDGIINTFKSDGTLSMSTTFSGISKNFFGFYFQPVANSAPTYYSVDSLNLNSEARVLAYDGSILGNSGILFSYEDGNDFDYQDAGFFVESIKSVPEASTMLLLGAGLLGFGVCRRRFAKM